MIRNCRGWLAAGVIASSITFVACKKDEQKPAPAPGAPADKTKPAPPAEKADDSAGLSAVLKPGVNADDLSLLPRDSEIVAGLNFAQLQQSALWQKFAAPRLLAGDMQQKLGEFKAKCGFDPMGAVKSVSIGMKGVGARKQEGVVVVHGPDKAKTLGCLEKMKDEAAKDGSTITRDGDTVTVASKTGDSAAMMFVGDDTLVVLVGPNATKDNVKTVAQGGSALKTSPSFVEMYNRIATNDSMWLLMNGRSPAFDQVQRMGIKPKAVYGSLNVSDGLSVDMRMRVDSADQATQLAQGFTTQVQPFAPMVDKLAITGDDKDVRFSVVISEQKLQQLVKNFGSMLGAFAGGGGGMGGTP